MKSSARTDRPKRIRLERSKGWRKPAGAVVVARPTKWGNPWHIGLDMTRARAVELHARWIKGEMGDELAEQRDRLLGSLGELRGRELACWCPLDGPCHADTLIEIANR